MQRKFHALFSGLAVVGLLTLAPSASAVAQQVSFTVTGAMTNTGQGYTAGQPVSLTFVLDQTATPLVSATPVLGCCGPSLAWQQDQFPQPQLWSSITGTGLSGAWLPPVDHDLGNLVVSTSKLADFSNPAFAANVFQMLASSRLGFPGGLFAPNGLPVSSMQVGASFHGLDPVASFGEGNVISPTVPDPTLMFLSMVGTYATNRIYSAGGYITTGAGQQSFSIDQLTIAAVVPEPSSGLLLAVGCGALGWLVRRRGATQL